MRSILIVVILGVLGSVSAMPTCNTTDFSSVVSQCYNESPIRLKNKIEIVKDITWEANNTPLIPDTAEWRCIFACALKKVGAMDDQGKLNATGLQNFFTFLVTRSKDTNTTITTKEMEDSIKPCLKVNDEPVSDGNKGCDRAGLLLKKLKSVPF